MGVYIKNVTYLINTKYKEGVNFFDLYRNPLHFYRGVFYQTNLTLRQLLHAEPEVVL